MEKRISFKFKFKGNRNYVHGTDLYNESIKFLSNNGYDDLSNIDMTFHKISKNQLSGLFYCEEDVSHLKDAAFIFSFYFKTKKHYIILKENDTIINDRYSYNEDGILLSSSFNIEDKSVLLKNFNGFSCIERIVALNKGLLERLYSQKKGKWYFSRLQLYTKFKSAPGDEIKIQLIRNMKFKLTKSIIYLNSEKVGHIYFTLI